MYFKDKHYKNLKRLSFYFGGGAFSHFFFMILNYHYENKEKYIETSSEQEINYSALIWWFSCCDLENEVIKT